MEAMQIVLSIRLSIEAHLNVQEVKDGGTTSRNRRMERDAT